MDPNDIEMILLGWELRLALPSPDKDVRLHYNTNAIAFHSVERNQTHVTSQ